MILQAGKFYRTQGGGKVECIAVRTELTQPAICLVNIDDPVLLSLETYHLNGTYDLTGSATCRLDIVAEWHDPVTKVEDFCLVRYPDGSVSICFEDSVYDESKQAEVIGSARLVLKEGVFHDEGND